MLAADAFLRHFGLGLRQAIGVEIPSEFTAILDRMFFALCVFQHYGLTGEGARLLGLEHCSAITGTTPIICMIERAVMIPAYDDISSLVIDDIENTGMGTVALIDQGDIPGLQVVMFETLPHCRIADMDFMTAERRQVDAQMQAVIGACGAGAFQGGAVIGDKAQAVWDGWEIIKTQQVFAQGAEKRCTAIETLPDGLIGEALSLESERSCNLSQGLLWTTVEKNRAEQLFG